MTSFMTLKYVVDKIKKVLIFFSALCCFLNFYALCFVYAEEIVYQHGERRDPFVPLVGPDGVLMKKIPTSDLIVEGIIYDPVEGSMALINGELYKPGDSINQAVIIRIHKDSVILSQEDEEKTIWLREELLTRNNQI